MTNDRVQEALAAYLEHLELGGAEPDLSHLSATERRSLDELIALLDQTEGIPFGRGLEEGERHLEATTEEGKGLVAVLHDALPPAARIAPDPAAATITIPDMNVVEGFIVGTFGGRVRVWLLADEDALESGDKWLRDLGRVFRLFPDTAAIALVEPDQSCLLVQPEDCAPNIEVPRGSLVGRRYRRPVHPVREALSVFLRELIPYWEPMQDIGDRPSRVVEVAPIANERANRAIEYQVAAGSRARKTNPKRKVLTELGDEEAGNIARLVLDVHDGRATAEDVEDKLRGLATKK